jgi:hypothetical protein
VAWLVGAVGDHQQHPLPPEVPDQEGQQVAGGAVGPVQVLHHQHQWGQLSQASEQAEQQLEQPGLGGLARRASTIRLTKGGQQAGKLWPGRAHQLADRFHADLGQQGPQRLHDRRVGQGPLAHRDAAAKKHPDAVGSAARRQLSN